MHAIWLGRYPRRIFCITIGKARSLVRLHSSLDYVQASHFSKSPVQRWREYVSFDNVIGCYVTKRERRECALLARANGVLFRYYDRRYSIYIYASAALEFRKGSFNAIEGFYLSIFVPVALKSNAAIVKVSKK